MRSGKNTSADEILPPSIGKRPDDDERYRLITSTSGYEERTISNASMNVLIVAMLVAWSAGAARAEDVAPDIAAGETSFKKCLPCHAVGAGAKNKFGPQLNGLDGRMSGTAGGYNFPATYRTSGVIWNETTFAAYVKDPQTVIPGAKTTFRAIKDENEAKNLWAYLSQFKADGAKD